MLHSLALVTVPHSNIGKSEKFPADAINGKNRMHQHTTKTTAFANRSIAFGAFLTAAQNDLARVLYRQHLPPGHAFRRVPGRSFTQTGHSHCRVAQKSPKPDFAAPLATCQSQNARPRRSRQNLMAPGPLFLSRKSPKLPTSKRPTSTEARSMAASRIQRQPIESALQRHIKTKMCASDSLILGGLPLQLPARSSYSVCPCAGTIMPLKLEVAS